MGCLWVYWRRITIVNMVCYMVRITVKILLSAIFVLGTAAIAAADEVHLPKEWQLGFQRPATPVMEQLDSMHDMLTMVCIAVTVFVLMLLLYVILRFREKNNPVPSKTSHNSFIEVVWTVIPVVILVAIAIPSLRLHYYMSEVQDPEMTLKVVGYQWYWNYEYPDYGGFSFDSYMVPEDKLQDGDPRLLKTDNPVVVPVDTVIKVEITAGDVIHSWAVPAFGVKRDAVPGRLNGSWFKATRTGTYYGQCSELCGIKHGFMPIEIKVVSKEEFAVWAKTAKQQFAANGVVNPQSALLAAQAAAQEAKMENL